MKFRPKKVPIFHAKASKFMTKERCAHLWHKRLGHVNSRYILETARRNAVRGLDLEEVKE